MSRVLSMRLREEQIERLRRMARRLGRTPSETGALLVEESLRRSEFGHIDFRDSPVGRRAYIQGSTLAVWEVVMVAQAYDMDVARTAEHLQWAPHHVQAALNYAAAFPDEVYAAIADNDAMDWETVSRILPHVELFTVPFEADE